MVYVCECSTCQGQKGCKIHLVLELGAVLNHPTWLLASELWFSVRATHSLTTEVSLQPNIYAFILIQKEF